MLKLKEKSNCEWSLVSLGEILLRFDPGDRRIHNARNFTVWDGGAEYNVAATLSRVFGRRTAIATALHDNAVGRLAEDLARGSGVDVSQIKWAEEGRNGIYFIDTGFGLRAPVSAFDREHTAISSLKKDDIDWNSIFKEKGVQWFHTGGVFTGLSEATPEAAIEAVKAAQANGTVVSYDLNYRNSLWGKRGGIEAANEINRQILPFVDVVFGTFDFDSKLSSFDENVFRSAASDMQQQFPNLKIIVSTLRETHSAGRHDLGGAAFDGNSVAVSKRFEQIEVLDRVGSGDAFAAGFIHGILSKESLQFSMDCGAASGALSMTMPGDVSMATKNEVFGLMKNAGAVVVR